MPFDDTRDFEDTDRGFIAGQQPCVVKAADGRVVWDNDEYSILAAKQGLYEVVEGIYQVRGLDLSNITFVEGDSGVIVIDPLISTEVAAAALALYREHRGGDRPVVAVIYTHAGTGGFRRACRAGERLRRHRDDPPRVVYVRHLAGPRTAGSGRLRSGSEHVNR